MHHELRWQSCTALTKLASTSCDRVNGACGIACACDRTTTPYAPWTSNSLSAAVTTLLHVRHTFERLDKCRGCQSKPLVSGNPPSGTKLWKSATLKQAEAKLSSCGPSRISWVPRHHNLCGRLRPLQYLSLTAMAHGCAHKKGEVRGGYRIWMDMGFAGRPGISMWAARASSCALCRGLVNGSGTVTRCSNNAGTRVKPMSSFHVISSLNYSAVTPPAPRHSVFIPPKGA